MLERMDHGGGGVGMQKHESFMAKFAEVVAKAYGLRAKSIF